MSVFVLMGVSGSGKSTVGQRVADELSLTFIEGDEFHSPENVRKMAAGLPLTDTDRAPWIDALAQHIDARLTRCDAVVACSALSKFVRDRLRAGITEPLHFILLTADAAIIEQRLSQRPRHFMKAGMLASQLAALDWPSDASVIEVARPLDEICSDVAAVIRHRNATASLHGRVR